MISDKFKCIFIHIPKNAGTSIESKLCAEEGLANLLPDHRTILDMEPFTINKICSLYRWEQCFSLMRRVKYFLNRNKIGSFYKTTSKLRYNNYFKFTIVRNPWSRVYSWYRNVIADVNHQKKYNAPPNYPFDLFIKFHLHHPALRTQFYWLYDSHGLIPMDFIGKFENLESDFSKIAETIGLNNPELPQKRYTGKSQSYVTAYNDNTKDIVWKKYKQEIDYFGFEFGE